MVDTDTFKIRDAGSYDELTRPFDRFTQRFSTYAVDALLARLPDDTRGDVLDIGCGTGVVTFAAADRFAQARVTGVDLSDGMLAFARGEAERRGLAERVGFRKMDAEALELETGSVDAAVSLYAWRHLPHPDVAAAEVHRVLRPGGRFVIAVGSAPRLLSAAGVAAAAAQPIRALARLRGRELAACDYLDRLVERALPPPDAREISDWSESHHAFSGSLEGLLTGAGFTVERSGWAGRTYVVDDPEDFWTVQATFSSTARKRLAAAPPDAVAALRRAFRADCERTLSRGGRLVYRVGAAVVSAIRG